MRFCYQNNRGGNRVSLKWKQHTGNCKLRIDRRNIYSEFVQRGTKKERKFISRDWIESGKWIDVKRNNKSKVWWITNEKHRDAAKLKTSDKLNRIKRITIKVPTNFTSYQMIFASNNFKKVRKILLLSFRTDSKLFSSK